MTDKPILPHDILHYVLNILPTKDCVALASISRATRTAALTLCFSRISFNVYLEDNSKARNALENATLAFRNSIKKIYINSRISTKDPWPTSVFEVLSVLPNLNSISSHRYIRLSQLTTFVDTIRHKPIHNLSIEIFTDVVIPVIAGLPGVETLVITWSYHALEEKLPNIDLNLGDLSMGLIQPSIDTLRDLSLDFSHRTDKEGAALNLELLKPAKLHTFSYAVPSTNTDMIAQLPENLAHVKNLSLLWKSWPGYGQPGFDKSFIPYFARLPRLTHLTLCLDLEKEVDDLMKFSHDIAWYNRSLHRRLLVSELLAKQCLSLERIDWVQLGIDSEGNEMRHAFVVEETSDSGRVVKTVMDWWMRDHYKEEHGGPLPDLITKKGFFIDFWQ